MKKFAAVLMIALASTTAFVGCSGDETKTENSTTAQVEKAPLKDLLNEMLEQNLVVMPMEIDETLAQEAYHIDLNVVDEYAITPWERFRCIFLSTCTCSSAIGYTLLIPVISKKQ